MSRTVSTIYYDIGRILWIASSLRATVLCFQWTSMLHIQCRWPLIECWTELARSFPQLWEFWRLVRGLIKCTAVIIGAVKHGRVRCLIQINVVIGSCILFYFRIIIGLIGILSCLSCWGYVRNRRMESYDCWTKQDVRLYSRASHWMWSSCYDDVPDCNK